MDRSQAVRIQYSSKNAGVANAWKKWQGEAGGIRRLGTVAAKQEYEKRFSEWAEGTGYETVLPRLDSLYGALEPYMFTQEYYAESAKSIELCNFAMSIGKQFKEYGRFLGSGKASDAAVTDSAKNAFFSGISKTAKSFYKDYYDPIDKESFIAVMSSFAEDVPEDFQPAYFKDGIAKYGSITVWADSLFCNSIFTDSTRVLTLTPADSAAVSDDPAFIFGNSFAEWFAKDIAPVCKRINSEITLLYRTYMKGQMAFEPEKAFYPDANLTLRVAYGKVQGYSPADGVYYEPSSTLEGIMEKDNPEIFDYDIPQRLRDIHSEKDYGRWAVTDAQGNTTVPVCFIATNHTSGGNSGSPVINADGDLMGINFDRVWEGFTFQYLSLRKPFRREDDPPRQPCQLQTVHI